MSWMLKLDTYLRANLPYCFPLTKFGGRQVLDGQEYKVVFGYICDEIEMRRKEAFMEGYAKGVMEAISQQYAENDVECVKHHAEKAWEGWVK